MNVYKVGFLYLDRTWSCSVKSDNKENAIKSARLLQGNYEVTSVEVGRELTESEVADFVKSDNSKNEKVVLSLPITHVLNKPPVLDVSEIKKRLKK